MAVIVKYVVAHNGKEDMIFSSKKEAEAYDKMLDIAERLYTFLQAAAIDIAEDQLDDLTFFMAQHRDHIGKLLKGGKLEIPDVGAKDARVPQEKVDKLSAPETKDSETSKSTGTTKSKAAA